MDELSASFFETINVLADQKAPAGKFYTRRHNCLFRASKLKNCKKRRRQCERLFKNFGYNINCLTSPHSNKENSSSLIWSDIVSLMVNLLLRIRSKQNSLKSNILWLLLKFTLYLLQLLELNQPKFYWLVQFHNWWNSIPRSLWMMLKLHSHKMIPQSMYLTWQT